MKLLPLVKILRLIPDEYRFKSIVLIILTFISTFIELLSIGIFIPILTFLSNPNLKNEYEILYSILIIFSPNKIFLTNYNDNIELIFSSSLIVLFLFFFKFIYISFFSWFQFRLCAEIEIKISTNLFKKYLKSPFSFFLKNNSATLIRNIHILCPQFASTVLNLMIIFSELLILISILVLVVFVDTYISLLLIFFGVSFLIYYLFVRSKLKNIGSKRIKFDEDKLRHLQQGINSIKDIKITQNESFFVKLFSFSKKNEAFLGVNISFFNIIPRLLFEGIAIIGLIFLIIFLILQDRSLEQIFPVLVILVASSYRVAPSLNKILTSLQNIRYSIVMIDIIYEQLENFINLDNKIKFESFKNGIEFKNVSFNYENNSKPIFKNINFYLERNKTYLLIGKSGSGKSTLINLLCNLLKPNSGSILIDNIASSDKKNLLKIGYVTQDTYLLDTSIEENIAFAENNNDIDKNKVKKIVKEVDLTDFVDSFDGGLRTSIGDKGNRISGGQRQRLAIARSLYNNPDILLFDESTNALDKFTEENIIELINSFKGKKTIVIISHLIHKKLKYDNILEISNKNVKLV